MLITLAVGIFSAAFTNCVIPTDIGPAASGYRNVSGFGNNIGNPTSGASGSVFSRVQAPAAWGDGLNTPSGANRPSAKLISNALFGASPSVAQNVLSDMTAYWGQFIAHDVGLSNTVANTEVIPLNVSMCELVGNRVPCQGYLTFSFSRCDYQYLPGSNVRSLTNFQTAFIDASTVYGATPSRLSSLREFSGGRLLVTVDPVTHQSLLPLTNNVTINQMANPLNRNLLFYAGDIRANVHPPLQCLHTLFVREHNRKAAEILSKNPGLSDEVVFQQARSWVIALVQKITIDQYVPAITGYSFPAYTGYIQYIPNDLDSFFNVGSFRYGHSVVSSLVLRIDANGNEVPYGHLLLRDNFFNPTAIINSHGVDIDNIFRGLLSQADQLADTIMIDDLREFFAAQPYDLASMDILRGRDFGVPDYNTVRAHLNLPVATTFQDITNDTQIAAMLASVYGSVNNVDAWVGGLAEPIYKDAHVGELFRTSLIQQFQNLRNGDRFWYERDGVLSASDLAEISTWSLGKVIKMNTNITSFPDNAFLFQANYFAPVTTKTKTTFLQLNSVYRVEWTISDAKTGMINFLLCGNFTGWMGIGFNAQNPTMTNADIVIAVNNNGWTVNDYYANGHVLPQLDTSLGGQSNVVYLSDAASECYSTQGVKFQRLATTNDAYDVDLSGPINIIFAYSDSGFQLAYHGINYRGIESGVNLMSGSTGSQETSTAQISSVLAYHGIIMFLALGIFYPTAFFAIKYLEENRNIVYIHRAIMTIATLLGTFGGLMVIVSGVDPSFTFTHSKIGITVVTLMLLNFVLGNAALSEFRIFTRHHRKIRFVHRMNGMLVGFLGSMNIFFGLNDISTGNLRISLFTLYALYLGFLVLFLWFGQLFKVVVRMMLNVYRAKSRRTLRDTSETNATGYDAKTLSFSWEEFNKRVQSGHQWLVISGNIYDVGNFASSHPGGEKLLKEQIGTNATRAFYGTISKMQDYKQNDDAATNAKFVRPSNLHSKVAMMKLKQLFVGIINVEELDEDEDDLFPNPRITEKTSTKLSEASKAILMSKKSIMTEYDIEHNFRSQCLQMAYPGSIKRLALSENYFLNLRMESKTLVSGEYAKNQTYKFKFLFERPHHTMHCVPGDHVELMMNISSRSTSWLRRKYTPIAVKSRGSLELIIKVYDTNGMTNYLNKLEPGDCVKVRGPCFTTTYLNKSAIGGCYKNVALIASGTGVTPMLLLMDYYILLRNRIEKEGLKHATKPQEISLIHAHHSKDDITSKKDIDRIVASSNGLVWPTLVLSTGHVNSLKESEKEEITIGKITSALLKTKINFFKDITGKAMNNATKAFDDSMNDYHIFVCGRNEFNADVFKMLTKELNIHQDFITLI